MADFMNMCDAIEKEINKIADKGLTSSNLETAYKLIDMYKDLKTIEAMEEAGYSEDYDDSISYRGRGRSYRGYNSMDGDSYRGRGEHYVRGHYSRESADPRERYMSAKESYRYSHANNDKQSMIDSLDDYMNEMSTKLQTMMNDADTNEERETIKRYMNKLNMR
jgi:hypothetical protein